MAIYKVILNGNCQGQDIKNVLYYRTGLGLDISGLTVGGTVEVANAVKTLVWPFMKPVLPTAYSLQDITAYVFNDGTFDLLYQNPTTVQVGENGLNAGAMNGPAVCAIVKFALEPTMILLNGPKPPKRGYLAIGPIVDSFIDDDGTMRLDAGLDLLWTALCAALKSDIVTILPPADFWPIRVHQDKILGLLRITSFADIRDASLRDGSSYRRSRMPEA